MPRFVDISPLAPSGAGPYSQAVRAGDFLFLSGIGALDVETHEIVGDTVEAQTHLTLQHMQTILKHHGAGLDDMVKIDVYLQHPLDYEAFNQVYESYFSPPYPARLTVGAGQVWDMLVKMDCVAYLGKPYQPENNHSV